MPLAPNTRLGRYEIRSQLGTGGMGEVYLALDTELDRTVAIKVLASGSQPTNSECNASSRKLKRLLP
jgi:serine/threonine protein kinase